MREQVEVVVARERDSEGVAPTNLRQYLRQALTNPGLVELDAKAGELRALLDGPMPDDGAALNLWRARTRDLGLTCCALGFSLGPPLFREALDCFEVIIYEAPPDDPYELGLAFNQMGATHAWFGGWLRRKGRASAEGQTVSSALCYEQALELLTTGTLASAQATHNLARSLYILAGERRDRETAARALGLFRQVAAMVWVDGELGTAFRLDRAFYDIEERIDEAQRLVEVLDKDIAKVPLRESAAKAERPASGNDAEANIEETTVVEDTGGATGAETLGDTFAEAESAEPPEPETFEAKAARVDAMVGELASQLQIDLDQARRFMPSERADQDALIAKVDRALELGVKFWVDGLKATRLHLRRGTSLTWGVGSSDGRSFRKYPIEVDYGRSGTAQVPDNKLDM